MTTSGDRVKTEFQIGDRVMHDQHGEVEVIRPAPRDTGRGYVVRAVHPTQHSGHYYHDGTPMFQRSGKFWAPFYMLSDITKG